MTVQVTATWKDHLLRLELRFGLDINNSNHIWLLHRLYLPQINAQLNFFAESWNQHRLQIRDGPNRSPADIFGFDMLVCGIRGYRLSAEPANADGFAESSSSSLPPYELTPLPPHGLQSDIDALSNDELEVFGVDWEGLEDNTLLESLGTNGGKNEGATSWIGRVGPPENLGGVELDAPDAPLSPAELQGLEQAVQPWIGRIDDTSIDNLWIHSLAYARNLYGHIFRLIH